MGAGRVGKQDVADSGSGDFSRSSSQLSGPVAEVPGGERLRSSAGAQPDLRSTLPHVDLDRVRRDSQAGGDLAVGIALADQGCHLLLAPGERLPALEQVALQLAAGQGLESRSAATSPAWRCSRSAAL